MLRPNEVYVWEMETADGQVLSQYDKAGEEQNWQTLPLDKIVRVSLIPRIPSIERHDCLIDIDKGERFIRRFGRGFLKFRDGYKLTIYINCIVTNNYRFWVFSDGRVLVTEKDYEVYL